MTEVTHGELIEFLRKFVEDHGSRISRYGLGSKADVQRDIQDGMQRVWLSMSQRPVVSK
jgi:hypothetical protein